MIPWLRELHPDPIAEIHPQVAEERGIEDGDWIYIESPRGRIKHRAWVTPTIDPRLVAIQHGWWFPEQKDPGHGWDQSSSNILTDNDPETYDVSMGASNLRVMLCKVYPVAEEEVS
ncbi:MAG: molybdopterin dinucleotide binding domain-containing protein, partial [Anaerolineae bacterium]